MTRRLLYRPWFLPLNVSNLLKNSQFLLFTQARFNTHLLRLLLRLVFSLKQQCTLVIAFLQPRYLSIIELFSARFSQLEFNIRLLGFQSSYRFLQLQLPFLVHLFNHFVISAVNFISRLFNSSSFSLFFSIN